MYYYLLGLFYLLGDEGDACLIPAPYYAAFENDMRIIARIVPFAVQMANPTQGPSASELDLAYIEAKSVSCVHKCVYPWYTILFHLVFYNHLIFLCFLIDETART